MAILSNSGCRTGMISGLFRAVAINCERDYAAVVDLGGAHLSRRAFKHYEYRMQGYAEEQALEIVLKYRKWKRGKGR